MREAGLQSGSVEEIRTQRLHSRDKTLIYKSVVVIRNNQRLPFWQEADIKALYSNSN
jgi:hypothetical protein